MYPLNEPLPKRTYRLVICDDEPYIAASTAALLRMKLPYETDIQVFQSSVQAYAYIQEHCIDLLISDIRMQQMDGLELMHQALGLWPASQCILLTAYTDFDYVYDAISHPGVAYVLKCDGHEALLDVAQKCLIRLENNLRQEHLTRYAKRQMANAMPLLRREWLLDLINGIPVENLDKTKRELALPLDMALPFSACLLLVHLYGHHAGFLEQLERIDLIAGLLEGLFPEHTRQLCVPLDRQCVLCLLQHPQQGAFPPGQLEGMLENLQQAASQQSIPLGIVYLPRIDQLDQLRQGYEALSQTQSAMVGGHEGLWLVPAHSGLPGRAALLDSRYIAKARSWRHAFENGDPSADSLLNELLTPFDAPGQSWDAVLMEMYMQLALQILSLLRSSDAVDLGRGGLSLMRLMNADQHPSVAEAGAYLRSAVVCIRSQQQASANTAAMETVTRVKSYIAAHLHEDISLTCLADHVGLNASYLSRVFRKATGETLMGYLSNARMELARQMLMDPRRQIQQISQELGFLTPAYFSYFFKKNEGLTPTEYRERHSIENLP